MTVLYLALGAFLLALAIVDIIWTTLWVDGGSGPLSSRLTTLLWRGLRKLGGRRSRTLSLAGPLILIVTLFAWVLLLWAGWVFLFAGDAGSLIDSRDQEPITWPGRIWYVAFTMFTVGNGDFYPRDGFWQVASGVTAASGMTFVTLGVSYVLSVLGAVSAKRSFASSVTGLGRRGEEVVEAGWDGESLHPLDLLLSTLASELGVLAEQHKSYPILHYYHSEEAEDAPAVAVAVLDEALTLVRFGVPEGVRPAPALLKGARASVGSYLETLNSAFIEPADHAPPSPDFGRLRAAGVPTVSEETFADALADLQDRRRKLLGMINADAWEWPPVERPGDRSAS